jgi:hypothetical protein
MSDEFIGWAEALRATWKLAQYVFEYVLSGAQDTGPITRPASMPGNPLISRRPDTDGRGAGMNQRADI